VTFLPLPAFLLDQPVRKQPKLRRCLSDRPYRE
jgi:hypothetical protein